MMAMLKAMVGVGLLVVAGCGGVVEQDDPPRIVADAGAAQAPGRDAGVAADAGVDASDGEACLRSVVVCECIPFGKLVPVTFGPECDKDGAQVVCDRMQLTGAMPCPVPTDAGTD